jgi:hypothetical protein
MKELIELLIRSVTTTRLKILTKVRVIEKNSTGVGINDL